MKPSHKNLYGFNPLPKIIEIAKDEEVPRQIIINDLVALEKKIRERYLHGKIVEEKGWKEETAERKMALVILGDSDNNI